MRQEGVRICGGARHEFWMPKVTDIGCRSCGLWSHGFVVPLPILGFEMKGVWASGGFGFGESDREVVGVGDERGLGEGKSV